jgi:hypothetical protein
MQTSSRRWTLTPTSRLDASSERRLSLALIALVSVATVSVLAATGALSQHHARELAALTGP